MAWLAVVGATVAWAQPCEPDEHVVEAYTQLVAGDSATAEQAIASAREHYGCANLSDRQSLARFWLVDGALSLTQGDPTAASDAFAAAKALAPDLWLPDLPASARAHWEAAVSPQGRGSLAFEPPLGARPVWVDGASVVGPADVSAGSHLVQVGDTDGRVMFADTVWVGPSLSILVETGLLPLSAEAPTAPVCPELPVEGPVEPSPVVDDNAGLIGITVAVGAGFASGEALSADENREPSLKVAVPLELGLSAHLGPVHPRLQVGVAGLVGGQYLGQSNGDAVAATPVRADAAIAVLVGGSVRGGLLGGVQYPGRIAGRGVLAWAPSSQRWWAELRAGANAVVDRAPEPAGALVVGVRLW